MKVPAKLSPGEKFYPAWLLGRDSSGPPLWYAGNLELLLTPGLALTGVREADPATIARAEALARGVSQAGLVVITGCARGVDLAASQAAFDSGGRVIGCPAESLVDWLARERAREMLASGRAVFFSLYGPCLPFSRVRAMVRNRLLMRLARAVIVVASHHGRGGSWGGALAAIKARARWGVPVFALKPGEEEAVERFVGKSRLQQTTKKNATKNETQDGNLGLIQAGAIGLDWPLSEEFLADPLAWLAAAKGAWSSGGQAELWAD